MDVVRVAQRIVDGRWRHASRARAACVASSWPAFVRETAPAAPVLLGRRDHEKCVTLASSTWSGPEDVRVRIVPIWVCDTEEGESTEWFAAHAMRVGDEAWGVVETGPIYADADADARVDDEVVCRARRWRVARVVPSASYAPGIPLLARHGAFAVLAGDVIVVDAADAGGRAALPQPAIGVPPFCGWREPRVGALDVADVAAIRALSITVDDEGNLIERPAI